MGMDVVKQAVETIKRMYNLSLLKLLERLPVENGGTGGATAEQARENLGIHLPLAVEDRGHGRGQCGRRAGESRYTIPVAHSKWGYGRHNGFGGSDKPGTARDIRHMDAEVNRVGRRHDVYDKL